LVPIGIEIFLGVIDRHPALLSLKISICIDWHAFVSPVAGLEIENRGPVIGEVLGEEASRAIRFVAERPRGVHGGIEGISAHNLVQMGRRDLARLNKGIEALDADGGASESETGLGRRHEGKREEKPLHLCESGFRQKRCSNGRKAQKKIVGLLVYFIYDLYNPETLS
jgi:hypothetical protein